MIFGYLTILLLFAGWSNNNNSGYRGQYPGAGSPGGPQQWGQGPSRPGAPPPPPQTNNQWPPPQPPYQSPQVFLHFTSDNVVLLIALLIAYKKRNLLEVATDSSISKIQ